MWILDFKDSQIPGDYSIINGSTTDFTHPFVMTILGNPAHQLFTPIILQHLHRQPGQRARQRAVGHRRRHALSDPAVAPPRLGDGATARKGPLRLEKPALCRPPIQTKPNQGDPHAYHDRELGGRDCDPAVHDPRSPRGGTRGTAGAHRGYPLAHQGARRRPVAGRAAGDDPGTCALLGDGLRLAHVRGEAERAAAVQDGDRRGGHPLHPREVTAFRRSAADHHARLARLGDGVARDRSARSPTRPPTAARPRTPSTWCCRPCPASASPPSRPRPAGTPAASRGRGRS